MVRTSRFRRPPGLVHLVVESAAVAGAGLGVYVVLGYLGFLPRPPFQFLLLAAGAALFPLRRRFPDAVLPALATLTGLVPALGPVTAATAYTVARQSERARRRTRLLAGAAGLLVVSAAAAGPRLGPGSVPYGLALGLVLAATAVVVPGLLGTVRGQQRRLVRALRERGDAAERARLLADSEARIHERSRIAAEMHDLVGHRLSLISLYAGGLELSLARAEPGLREEAVLVRRTTRDAMRELRQALGVLGPLGRDTGSDALTDATGTRADIETLVAESGDGGIAVELDWTGPDLDARPAPVRRAVHRVVREALTNVHRYAPSAHVTVTVAHDEETVRVTVRNGAPPHPAAPPAERGTGRGLTGLRERVELLGGTFEAAPLPSGGFRVEAAVPGEPGDAPDRNPPQLTGPASASRPADAYDPQDAPGRRTAEVLTLACGLLTLCVLMVLGIAFVYAAHPDGRRHGPAPLPRVGDSYADVGAAGVSDNKAVRAAATGHEPPRPAGAAGCVYPFNGATETRPGTLTVARYCFDASQRLIAIDRFDVPSVRDAMPWETP
ncbi:sensor histidine kinase [Streptomyces sp. NPDC085524]|uniref:sensor histidine kinase n=1 Tax=Streptomyces sp. NPDC085524 TaxID=3365728 RepID=UPI0037D38F94